MKSLFTQSDCSDIIARINKLAPDTKSQWGKMNVAQMMTHSHRALKTAYGELPLKRSFMGILLGSIAKKKLISDAPWKHNMPTDKAFVVSDQRNFEEEKIALIGSVQRFAQGGPNGVSKDPHPFFGNLTTQEWDKLMWNHLDHHLRQFGA